MEEVASRLGLPVAMLIRRIEAGTLPGRRLDGPDGVQYRVAAAVLPATPEGTESLPGTDGGNDVWSEIASPKHNGSDAIADRRETRRVEATPKAVGPAQVIEAPGRAVNGDAEGHKVIARTEPTRLAELAREGAVAPEIDARELVAALLERWERTFEQRIRAEHQLRHEAVLADERTAQQRVRSENDRLRADLTAAIEARERDINAARGALANRDRDLAALREQLHTRLAAILERDRLIAERDRVISARDRLVHQLRGEVGQKDRLIADLRDRAVESVKKSGRRGGLFDR